MQLTGIYQFQIRQLCSLQGYFDFKFHVSQLRTSIQAYVDLNTQSYHVYGSYDTQVDDGNYLGEDAPHPTAKNLVFPVKKMTHKKVTLAKVTAKNDPPSQPASQVIGLLWHPPFHVHTSSLYGYKLQKRGCGLVLYYYCRLCHGEGDLTHSQRLTRSQPIIEIRNDDRHLGQPGQNDWLSLHRESRLKSAQTTAPLA